ncbi:Glycoside hydrolase family 13 protein [Ceratobasidium theobromae]|uniref:Alpha-amylase n=1 Tax=Ceratobasidium theobromae TaxID=1582974 RepID=A0A5N5QAS7_9AGAM|nr:Glycoside hydrolase family 13 protein [Ceratobasidium theobromae]
MYPPRYVSVWALALLASSATGAPYYDAKRAPSASKIIVQMFEWTWDSIAAECTNFLGPAGYGYVQVSPPAEHITGSQWWTDYQPVSYILTSKRGNRSQFQNMVSTCKTAGVGVIADTIFNHMAGIDSGTGVAGSTFTHYVYPGIYQYQDFHHCGLEPNDDIVNYTNRLEVQTCELSNLADLATDTEYVRATLATYANDLISLGVVGLRLDAAKHIAASDISNILSRLSTTVIYGAGEPITPAEYTGNGDVQEFRYTTALKDAFGSSGISSLYGLENNGWVSGSGANVFVANHDTERNGNSLNHNSGSNIYTLATVFSLSYPYGTPTILSSYSFSTTDDGAPNSGAGTCSGSTGTNGWLCQHRWAAVAGMVPWFNSVSGTSLTNWQTGTSQQIAFGRGAVGFVVINNADSAWSTTFTTSLPAGSYCDVISGTASSGSCTGTSYTVSSGSFTASVAARSAIAIYTGALGTGIGSSSGSGTVSVTFQEYATTTYGDNIFVVGSISQLGSWAPDSSIAMSSASYPTWAVTISLAVSTTFEYKYIRKTSSGTIDMSLSSRLTSFASRTFGTSGRLTRITPSSLPKPLTRNYSPHSHSHSHPHPHSHSHSHASQNHVKRIPRPSRGVAAALLAVSVGSASYVAGSLYPPTTLQLINPPPAPPAPALGTEEAIIYTTALEERLQNLDIVREFRGKEGWYESRPFQNYPEERRRHTLTSGTLRGPGKLALPPLVFAKEDEAEAIAIVHVGRSMCGHDGIVHGGLLATLLDEALGRNALLNLPARVGVTANLSINYRAPARADQFIVIHTRLDKANGRKVNVSGSISSAESKEVLTEATALFVQPKYAHLLNASGEIEKVLGTRSSPSTKAVSSEGAKQTVKVPQEATI